MVVIFCLVLVDEYRQVGGSEREGGGSSGSPSRADYFVEEGVRVKRDIPIASTAGGDPGVLYWSSSFLLLFVILRKLVTEPTVLSKGVAGRKITGQRVTVRDEYSACGTQVWLFPEGYLRRTRWWIERKGLRRGRGGAGE